MRNNIIMFRGSEINVHGSMYRVAFDVASKQWGYVQHRPIGRAILSSIWGWPQESFCPISEVILNASSLSDGQVIDIGPHKKIVIHNAQNPLNKIDFSQLAQCICEVCK